MSFSSFGSWGVSALEGGFPRYMSLPVIVSAVDEAEGHIKAPRALVFSSALTAIAIASQGLIDVCKPNGQIVPASLMLLTIANSGERKSTAENIFLRGVRHFQDEKDLIYLKELSDWNAKWSVWEARRKAMLKEILRSGDEGESEEYRIFMAHMGNEPVKPRRFKLIYEDATSEALFLGLYQNIPAAGLISSEGGGVLTGKAFNDLSKQNALWSGDAITVDRVSSENYELRARLTVSIMVQEKTFLSYMAKNGEISRGSGLWARFLVCNPRSTQGTRLIGGGVATWNCCEKFSERIGEILKESVGFLMGPARSRLVIKFSQAAAQKWIEIFNTVESAIGPGGRFFGMGDHASKLADNIARVAALFHFFERRSGDIALETLDAAIDVCFWYSGEFLRLFSSPPQEEIDAQELDDWLQVRREAGERFVPKNIILQKGPGKLRKVKRLDSAIEVLSAQGKVSRSKFENVTYLDILPEYSMSNFSSRTIISPYKSSI
ncbi:YfjI family protein [Pseudomonas putida]|uniref:YfjI family protein n=1 Tax=Pseudomonas putida TaxID=303 RepID=UPI001F2C3889|nr:YfjI family protein [Pseudomonas putida]